MKPFEEITKKWEAICFSDPEILPMLKENLSLLLNHPQEEYVNQGVELLTQFGSCFLVFILEQKEKGIDRCD